MGESRQKVLYREITTYYGVSEMLECGHRYESLTLLADSLVAKHRVCPKCQQALPQKKPPLPADAQHDLRKRG